MKQIALVQADGLFERVRGTVGHALLEPGDVHVHDCGAQSERLTLDEQDGRRCRRQCSPKAGEGVAQAVTRALVTRITPEERSELVARVGVARPDPEVGEQGLGFASGQAHRFARRESGLKPSEERQAERHGCWDAVGETPGSRNPPPR
jgi:hypothetical protein